MSHTPEVAVAQLLSELEREEPISFDLGTPDITDSDAFRRLLELGRSIVPALIRELSENRSSKRDAYAARALGRIGVGGALGTLRAAEKRYADRAPKDEWDHAAIGQIRLAIEALEGDA
jgi:hypothetical protein